MIAILSFLSSGLGRIVLIVAAVGAWTLYQRHDAARDARAACQEETLRRTVQEIERQRNAAQAALDEAEKRAQESDAENMKLERERDAIIEQSKTGAAPSCRIDAATRKRLLNIR